MPPRTVTFSPSSGRKRNPRTWSRKQTQRICAFSSFSVKYKCPDCAARKFETSPSTHTSGNSASSTSHKRSVISLTRQTCFSGIRLSENWVVIDYSLCAKANHLLRSPSLPSNRIHNPQNHRQHHAHNHACDNRKINAPVPPMIADVSRQTPQPERQFRARHEKHAHRRDDQPKNQQHFPEFAQRRHRPHILSNFLANRLLVRKICLAVIAERERINLNSRRRRNQIHHVRAKLRIRRGVVHPRRIHINVRMPLRVDLHVRAFVRSREILPILQNVKPLRLSRRDVHHCVELRRVIFHAHARTIWPGLLLLAL